MSLPVHMFINSQSKKFHIFHFFDFFALIENSKWFNLEMIYIKFYYMCLISIWG
jgi:hypothetical protein